MNNSQNLNKNLKPNSTISEEDKIAFQLENVRRERAAKEFKKFVEYTFKNYDWNWHHEEIVSALQQVVDGTLKRLMIFMPPRHGKSELASVRLPPFYLGVHPEREIIAASYGGDLATDFGRESRDLMVSADYKNVFDVRLKIDVQAANKWDTDQGGSYIATGIGGATTGRGADLFLIDDPLKDREEANSKLIRDKVWNWYRAVARTRLSPGGAIVLIQTRWHDDDLAGRLLAQEQEKLAAGTLDANMKWKVLSFPAIATKDELFRRKGEALWPKQYNLKNLLDTKSDLGSYEWSALYQQNPVDEESAEFKRSYFIKIKEEDVQKKKTNRFLTVDSALTKKDTSCDTGFCDNRVDKDNFWHIKSWSKKMSSGELMRYLFVLYETYEYDEIGIEETLFVEALKEFYEEEMRRRNVFLPLVYMKTKQQSKDLRLRGVLPRYEAHSVFHIEGWSEDLEDELIRFPASKTRDKSDALAYQKQLAVAPGDPKEKEREDEADKNVKDPNDIFNTGVGESDDNDSEFGINF